MGLSRGTISLGRNNDTGRRMESGGPCRFGTSRSGLPDARKGLTPQVDSVVIQMSLSFVWIELFWNSSVSGKLKPSCGFNFFEVTKLQVALQDDFENILNVFDEILSPRANPIHHTRFFQKTFTDPHGPIPPLLRKN